MWLLLVTAEKGCRKVTRLSCKSKTYLGVCHRHSLFTNENKTTSGLLWLLEIHTQRKAINVNTRHHWTQDNKIRAESYYQQLFMTLSKPATLLVLFSDHSWHEQLLDVSMQKKTHHFSPSNEEMTTLLSWVCSQTIKITEPVGQHWENLWN